MRSTFMIIFSILLLLNLFAHPLHSFAEEATSVDETDYFTPSENIEQIMVDTASHLIHMDMLSSDIQQQYDVMSAGEHTLKQSMATTAFPSSLFKIATVHMSKWSNDVRPMVKSTNQQIIQYGATFLDHYNALVTFANDDDLESVQNELNILKSEIGIQKNSVEQLITSFSDYRNDLSSDVRQFKKESDAILLQLEGENAIIQTLNKEISNLKKSIEKNKAIISVGAIGGIFGLPAVITASINLKKDKEKLSQKQAELNAAMAQVGALKLMDSVVHSFLTSVESVLESLQQLNTEWLFMDAKFVTLFDSLADIQELGLIFIIPNLNTAKDSWEDIVSYAEILN
ncbi:HBL/NHE enterotoxin family protein [Longirhabdus pacifica]|uniref:HBL/NHE enterotoxin family protein n=1 Tax=Longirhabdus pacifica TaxID=2305227 RepID=UPI0013E8E217|nr:HBL/NHE enterotoxin family protein [Longirhabdus pacifica]